MKLSPWKVGQLGEKLIYELLPNSKWNNIFGESRNFYDVEWEGIKIDVKTSTFKIRRGFQFSTTTSRSGNHADLQILVGLDTKEKQKYLWVLRAKSGSTFVSLEKAIKEEDLEKEIRNLFDKPK